MNAVMSSEYNPIRHIHMNPSFGLFENQKLGSGLNVVKMSSRSRREVVEKSSRSRREVVEESSKCDVFSFLLRSSEGKSWLLMIFSPTRHFYVLDREKWTRTNDALEFEFKMSRILHRRSN